MINRCSILSAGSAAVRQSECELLMFGISLMMKSLSPILIIKHVNVLREPLHILDLVS